MGDYGFAPNRLFIYSPALTSFDSSFLLPSTLLFYSSSFDINSPPQTSHHRRHLRIPLSLSKSKSKEEKEEGKEEPFNSKRPCFHCDNKIRVLFPLNFQLHFSSLTQDLSQGYGVNSIALGSNC